MKICKYAISALLLASCALCAAKGHTTSVENLDGEKWWGAATFFVQFMPYGDFKEKNIGKSNYSNQISPFFVSNKGRYIWSDKPFKFSSKDGVLTITSEFEKIEPVPAGKTMKEAFLAAAKKHFPHREQYRPNCFFPPRNTTHGLSFRITKIKKT